MKTILFVIESLHCGGAEKSLIALLNNLDFEKYSVDLLLIKKGGEFEKFVPTQVNMVYDNSIEESNFFKRSLARLQFFIGRKQKENKKYNSAHVFWKAYSPIIKSVKKQYDIAIGYSQGFATYFVTDKVIAKKKFSWLNIDYNYAKHYASFDYTKYKKLNRVVCVSEECKNSLLKAMNNIGKSLPITIIKDITDPKIVGKLSNDDEGFSSKEEGTTVLLTVCRLAKQKGLHLAVDACEKLMQQRINVKWYIIGVGTEKKFLENRIKEKSLQNNMILLGFKENPYPYMRTCDIYVQTSLFEGLGLTVIEAAILNKPIVSTNFPTAHTIINHNKTGLIVEMNPDAIANNILRYIKNPDFTKKIQNQLSLQDKDSDKEVSLREFNSSILENRVYQ